MKAILIDFLAMTRIVVPDDFDIDNPTKDDKSYKMLIEKLKPKMREIVDNMDANNIGLAEEDTETPFGTSRDDEYFQPKFEEGNGVIDKLSSFQVFASREIAEKAFPGVEILTYHGDDIEDVTFVDNEYKDI